MSCTRPVVYAGPRLRSIRPRIASAVIVPDWALIPSDPKNPLAPIAMTATASTKTSCARFISITCWLLVENVVAIRQRLHHELLCRPDRRGRLADDFHKRGAIEAGLDG